MTDRLARMSDDVRQVIEWNFDQINSVVDPNSPLRIPHPITDKGKSRVAVFRLITSIKSEGMDAKYVFSHFEDEE